MKAQDVPANAQKGFETLLYQLLETELGGVRVYETALRCAVRADLREEWEKHRAQAQRHVEIARQLLVAFNRDPEAEVGTRLPARAVSESLIKAMEDARRSTPGEAQRTAAECVLKAETSDRMNWELLEALVTELRSGPRKTPSAAQIEVERQKDHSLYHDAGWACDIWLDTLGLPPGSPPREEKKEATLATAHAKQPSRDRFL